MRLWPPAPWTRRQGSSSLGTHSLPPPSAAGAGRPGSRGFVGVGSQGFPPPEDGGGDSGGGGGVFSRAAGHVLESLGLMGASSPRGERNIGGVGGRGRANVSWPPQSGFEDEELAL